jgi:hypothetical protein
MRRAMRSRFCSLLDAFHVIRALENRVDENARCVYLIGGQLTGLDELLHFSNHVFGGGSHHGIEVARGPAVDEIAPAVPLPSLDEGEIATECSFEHKVTAIEFTRLLPLRDHGAVTGGRVKSRNSCATSADAFRERALWI